MTATRLRRGIYHDDRYAMANSITGDRIAARAHLWADRDVTYCLFGRVVIQHPGQDDWYYRGKLVTRPLRQIPLYRVLQMTARGGYRIRTLAQMLRDCKRLGVPGIELDMKFVPSQRCANRMAKAARKTWGPDWARHVEVKIWSHLDYLTALERLSRAGFTTTVIRYAGNPADLPTYVDHYRP